MQAYSDDLPPELVNKVMLFTSTILIRIAFQQLHITSDDHDDERHVNENTVLFSEI